MATTTTQNTTSQIPAFLQSRLENLLGRAETISQTPYATYGGPRIAVPTTDQATAQAETRANQGAYRPLVDKAQDFYTKAGTYDPAAVQQFRNPYITNVADQIATLGNRNLTENVLPGINNTFTGAGQFGSRRNYDFTNRALRDNQEAISSAQGTALYNAENAAQTAAANDRQQAGTAASGLSTLAGQQQTLQTNDVNALNASGAAQQGQTQKNYDTAYQDYLTQQQYPQQQLGILQNAVYGAPQQKDETKSITNPSPSTGTSLLSLAGLGGLAYAGLKKGGKVRKKKMAKRRKKMVK